MSVCVCCFTFSIWKIGENETKNGIEKIRRNKKKTEGMRERKRNAKQIEIIQTTEERKKRQEKGRRVAVTVLISAHTSKIERV